jgi:ubiquinone/menaquinone biosynthesis C-methylase UbiE
MNERSTASQEQIAAAMAYEDFFVKGLFKEWTIRVMDAAQIRSGHWVLDVGCGTGVLARDAAMRVGPTGFVAGLDPSPGMLAVAKQLTPTVEWWQGSAESLPFPNQSFDVAVSQFGLMFFSERQLAIREMLRVLKPQGQLAVAVWDSIDRIPAYAVEMALLERVAGKRAANALRAPFVLGDRQELATLFERAGTASVEITTQPGTARFPSIRMMVEADLRGWLPVMDVVLPEEQIRRILEEAEGDLKSYLNSDGRVVFESSAHIVTGTNQ